MMISALEKDKAEQKVRWSSVAAAILIMWTGEVTLELSLERGDGESISPPGKRLTGRRNSIC